MRRRPRGHICAVCHVGRRSDWHDLDETSLTVLERGRRRHELGSGEAVFAQGERNDGVYCVSGGTVGIRRFDSSGGSAPSSWPIRATRSDTGYFLYP